MWTFLLISIVIAVSTSSPTGKSSQFCEQSFGFRICKDASGVLKATNIDHYGNMLEIIPKDYNAYLTCTPSVIHITSESFQEVWPVPGINFECVKLRGLKKPFKDIPILERLSFGKNGFTKFPHKLCADIPDLKTITMRDQQIRTLSPASFPGITQNLERLNLVSIELEFIERQTFKRFIHLRSLELNKNRLEVLRPDMFDGLSELEYLELDKNQLREIKPGTFSSLKKLGLLILDNNRLGSLPAGIFDELEDLMTLGLFGNAFTSLPYNWLHGHLLTILSLGFSKQIQIEPDLFRGLDLGLLKLNADPLKFLKAGAFNGLLTTELILNCNDTIDFPTNLFKGMTVKTVTIYDDTMSPIDKRRWGLGNDTDVYVKTTKGTMIGVY